MDSTADLVPDFMGMAVGLMKWSYGLLIVLPVLSLWQERDIFVNMDLVLILGLVAIVSMTGTRDEVSVLVLVTCLIFLWDSGNVQLVFQCPVQGAVVQNNVQSSGTAEVRGVQRSGSYSGTHGGLRDVMSWTYELLWDVLQSRVRDVMAEYCLTADSAEECRDLWVTYGTCMFASACMYLCMLAQGPSVDYLPDTEHWD